MPKSIHFQETLYIGGPERVVGNGEITQAADEHLAISGLPVIRPILRIFSRDHAVPTVATRGLFFPL